MTRERGSVTFWMLGLALCFLTLGVLSVDLWNLMAHRRELAALTDAGAVAAASAIDESAWRTTHTLTLDRPAARERARALLDAHPEITSDLELATGWITFDPDGTTVQLTLTRTVDTALLTLAGREAVTIGAASRATATHQD